MFNSAQFPEKLLVAQTSLYFPMPVWREVSDGSSSDASAMVLETATQYSFTNCGKEFADMSGY